MSKILPLVGTALIATCAAGLGYLAITADDMSLSPHDQNTAQNVTDPVPKQRSSLELPVTRPDMVYAAITDRPIFAPSRRPKVQEADATPAAVQPAPTETSQTTLWPEGVILTGVLGGTDDRAAFIVTNNDDGQWLRINDRFEGWRVSEIGSEWIIFTADGDDIRLELFE